MGREWRTALYPGAISVAEVVTLPVEVTVSVTITAAITMAILNVVTVKL